MRTLLVSLCLSLVLIVASITAAGAAVSVGAVFSAARAAHAPALDASLRDAAWSAGAIRPPDFWNVTKRRPAQFPTQVYLLYDDRNLYVAFHAEQRGAPIVAQQTTNNVGFGLDDFVGVAIDSSANGSQVYFFETTPRGIRYQQSSENVRYFPRWQSAATIAGDSWNAVLVIPLDVIRMPPGPRKTWRFNFIRAIAAQGEHYTWAYDGLMSDGTVGQSWPAFADARYWPAITVDGVSTTARFTRPQPHAEIYALGSTGTDRDQFQQGNGGFARQNVRPVGLDVTIPITNTINAVGTMNPDFSNVEVDRQTIAPQEFALQLQEYRPFFAQGANFLNVSGDTFSSTTSPNNEIFYSPKIGPFDRGAKVEGTFGKQSFGVLSFRGFDQTTGNTFDDVAYGYKHALPDRSFRYWAQGVIAHHSLAGDDATTDIGMDGRNPKSGFQWGTGDTFEHGSWVPVTGVAHVNNTYVGIFKSNYTAVLGYNDAGPNYNPIDGFTFNSDIHGFQTYWSVSGATRSVKNFSVALLGDRWFDNSGAVHEADMLGQFSATFNNGLAIKNLGPSVGILRTYDVPENNDCSAPSVGRSSFTGFPCYRNGLDQRFDLFNVGLGYRDGTPRPLDASYSFGPFGSNYTRLFSVSTSRPIGLYSLGVEYDGTYERAFSTGILDSQWLRRISVGRSLGAESNVSVSIRSINGLGGFASSSGTNLSFAYHRRFTNGNELFVNYGTPAAFTTLHRLITKYVFHAGGDAGT